MPDLSSGEIDTGSLMLQLSMLKNEVSQKVDQEFVKDLNDQTCESLEELREQFNMLKDNDFVSLVDRVSECEAQIQILLSRG